MRKEDVARWLFEAGDEATKFSPGRVDPKGPPEVLWAALTPSQQAVSVAFARSAYAAGLRRAQELAKEHAHVKFNVVHGEVIEWEQSDRAIDAEVAKEEK